MAVNLYCFSKDGKQQYTHSVAGGSSNAIEHIGGNFFLISYSLAFPSLNKDIFLIYMNSKGAYSIKKLMTFTNRSVVGLAHTGGAEYFAIINQQTLPPSTLVNLYHLDSTATARHVLSTNMGRSTNFNCATYDGKHLYTIYTVGDPNILRVLIRKPTTRKMYTLRTVSLINIIGNEKGLAFDKGLSHQGKSLYYVAESEGTYTLYLIETKGATATILNSNVLPTAVNAICTDGKFIYGIK